MERIKHKKTSTCTHTTYYKFMQAVSKCHWDQCTHKINLCDYSCLCSLTREAYFQHNDIKLLIWTGYMESFKPWNLLLNHMCLTNQSQFSMVSTLRDHRNDVIKCSKLKWNHEPQVSSFIAKFWIFDSTISMVYKSVDHGKLWSICFLQ